jgi:hypothetical protein
MNDEPVLNEEQLRLATSRHLPANAALDAETAALREGFVALGSALEATGQFDEAGLIERLRKVTVPEKPGVEQCSRKGAEAQRNLDCAALDSLNPSPCSSAPLRENFAGDWSLLFNAALAAAALIAIVRIGTEWRRGERAAVAVVKAPNDTAVVDNDVPAAAPLGIGWNDPLDDEIALAAATMGQFSAGSRGVDASLLDMNQELFLLSQELLGESL